MKHTIAAFIASCALALGGCIVDRPYGSDLDDDRFEPFSSFSNYTNQDLQLVRGRLVGDIGPMRAFDEPAQLSGYHDTGFTSVEVIATNDRGSAMALLDFHGGITHEDLVPGAELVFRSGSPPQDDGDLYVTGLGCSGDGEPGEWDYDQPLQEIQLRVDETDHPDVVRVNFTTFTRNDEASGYIDVALRE